MKRSESNRATRSTARAADADAAGLRGTGDMSKTVARLSDDYATLLAEVKQRVRSAQYAALRAVNKELVALYWDIGRMIVAHQKAGTRGDTVVKRLAADL